LGTDISMPTRMELDQIILFDILKADFFIAVSNIIGNHFFYYECSCSWAI
jgi:hypothetical protein